MKFSPAPICGALVIQLEAREDSRGSFARTFCAKELAKQGVHFQVGHGELSLSRKRGTLRGSLLPLEAPRMARIIRCTRGAIFNVLVDCRPESPSFQMRFEHELRSENLACLLVPSMVAHGYQTLTDETEVVSLFEASRTSPSEVLESGQAISLGIRWPLPPWNGSTNETSSCAGTAWVS